MINLRSQNNLKDVHPDLVMLVTLANNHFADEDKDFIVTEGVRTIERQKELMAKGATKTLKSRHLRTWTEDHGLVAHAIDVAPTLGGKVRWDWPLFHKIHEAFKKASAECGIEFEWGGSWASFPDGPHFQLPHNQYPVLETPKYDED